MTNYILSFVLLLAIGCQTAPVRMTGVQEGHWKAKALIKDKEQSRYYLVNLKFNLVSDQRALMDVISTLGTGVASLVMREKEVRYILLDSKRFYFGRPQPNVMRPILALPFDPRWLQNILLEEPFKEKSWSCTSKKGGLLESCTDSVTGLKITWSARQGSKRTIFVEHAKASVQINIQSFEPKVEDRKNLFVLEAPAGFQKLRVR